MGALLPRLLVHTPSIIKRQALLQLFQATAAGFQCNMPRLRRFSREQCLLAYAEFTTEWAEEALHRGDDLSQLRERLYRSAYRLGRTPGQLLGVHTVEDAMALARFFYGILDIDFKGSNSGEITISRCYFSGFYSPEVCRVISAMDRGLLAGMVGGGDLVFTQRITEGHACCRARFCRGDSTRSI